MDIAFRLSVMVMICAFLALAAQRAQQISHSDPFFEA